MPGPTGDTVYAVDLEQSIRYALTVEIPMQQFLDTVKLKTIYQYLEVIVRYLPLRPKLLNFLKALREWPVMMDIRSESCSKICSGMVKDE